MHNLISELPRHATRASMQSRSSPSRFSILSLSFFSFGSEFKAARSAIMFAALCTYLNFLSPSSSVVRDSVSISATFSSPISLFSLVAFRFPILLLANWLTSLPYASETACLSRIRFAAASVLLLKRSVARIDSRRENCRWCSLSSSAFSTPEPLSKKAVVKRTKESPTRTS